MDAEHDLKVAMLRIAELEQELERLKADGVHTCSATCQRVPCVQRRMIAELEQARRWIPVEERLPEVGVEVLAYDLGLTYVTFWNGDEWDEWNEIAEITHWMPLPTPPTGDEE